MSSHVQELLSIDRLKAMIQQEQRMYDHSNFLSTKQNAAPSLLVDSVVWREKICTWTYSVIDHFHLSRSTVAVSMNLYDRYLATCGDKYEGRFALLCSLSTLYISIKLHEPKSTIDRCGMSQLCKLSRDQFRPKDIANMELKILHALSWLVNPPLPTDFIALILNLLPHAVHPFVRQRIFELSQYIIELTVCDPFFIQTPPSVIAFAALLNVLEEDIDYLSFSSANRHIFLQNLEDTLSLHKSDQGVRRHRKRMKNILSLQDDAKETKQPPSPSCVRDFDDQLIEQDQKDLKNCRSVGGHKRNPTADSVELHRLNGTKRGHRRTSSVDSSDLKRMQLASGRHSNVGRGRTMV